LSGTFSTRPTDRTPGSARSRCMKARSNRANDGPSLSSGRSGAIWKVKTSFVS
jgi:hypothetical protein